MIKRNIFLMLGAAVLLGLGMVMLTIGSSEATICSVVGYVYRTCSGIGTYFVIGSINIVLAFVLLMFLKEKS